MASKPLIEFRCPNPACGQLLMKVSALTGLEVEIRCPRCKREGRESMVKAELQPAEEE